MRASRASVRTSAHLHVTLVCVATRIPFCCSLTVKRKQRAGEPYAEFLKRGGAEDRETARLKKAAAGVASTTPPARRRLAQPRVEQSTLIPAPVTTLAVLAPCIMYA